MTSRWLARLGEEGLRPQQVVAMSGDYSPESCALILALADLGSVVVPFGAITEAEQAAFEQIANVEMLVQIGPHGASVLKRDRMVSNGLLQEFARRGRPGLVLFSSGSTGDPKAILHDLTLLMAKFRAPRPALRTIAFLLLDHIGGINTLFHTLSNGGTIVVSKSRNPGDVCAAIERHRVELLPTSPTFLNLLLISGEYERFDLSSLKVVTYGTEVMPESTLSRLRTAVPHADLRQTYGLSEVGILRAKSRDASTTWVKVGGEGYEIRVDDGTLRIRAETAMVGYLNYPSPFDDGGWFDTGDLVERDGDYLRFLGRKSDMINVGGQKVYPAEVESVLLQMPEVAEVAVHGESHPLMGHIVVARMRPAVPLPSVELRQRVRQFCASRLQPYKVPSKIVISDDALHNARFKKVGFAKEGQGQDA